MNAPDPIPPPATPTTPVEPKAKQSQRVWRACETCRRRKVKCSASQPCSYCVASGKICIFKDSADNASLARQQTNSVESRLGRVEESLQRFVPMAQAFERWMERNDGTTPFPFSLPPKSAATPPVSRIPYRPSPAIQRLSAQPTNGHTPQSPAASVLSAEHDAPDGPERFPDKFSHLTKDSYGNLRFTGGTSSFMLVDALTSLQNPAADASPESDRSARNTVDVTLPFFAPNKRFRAQQALPLPDDLQYPPSEMADELVATYFSRIHHTFPILHQQMFMERYMKAMEAYYACKPSTDHAFLAVIFAVFACGACLMPKPKAKTPPRPDGEVVIADFSGMEFYEKAQLIIWSVAGSSQIEHVQCLSLMAICNASWNTLAQSWINAGQAIRRAQDLGLHRVTRRSPLTALEKEMRRRVWWSIYGLDRVLSICLGRPSGAHDDDCNVEFPAEYDDIQLIASLEGRPVSPNPESYMAGFVALIKIYVIAGKVARFVQNAHLDDPKNEETRESVARLDGELAKWSAELPANFRHPNAGKGTTNARLLSLSTISLFAYYSSIINLHRPFIPDFPTPSSNLTSLGRCLTAARSCIHIAAQTEQIVPTSHHLAFAVQYITLSGVLLLRCIVYVNEAPLVSAIIQDAEKCITILEGIEDIWPASKRCCEIVSDLLVIVRTKLTGGPAAILDLQAAQANSRHQSTAPSEFRGGHGPGEYEAAKGKRKRSPSMHGHDDVGPSASSSRQRLDSGDGGPSSWPPAPQYQHPDHMPPSHYSDGRYPPRRERDDGRHRVSNLRTSMEMEMEMHQQRGQQMNPGLGQMYSQSVPPHMHSGMQQQQHQHPGHPPHHHHGPYPNPPQISLDINGLHHDPEGLPYSGYNFLGDDLETLLGNVIKPQAEPSAQTFEDNATVLWEAYRHGQREMAFGGPPAGPG